MEKRNAICPERPSATAICDVRVVTAEILIPEAAPTGIGARVDFYGIVRPEENGQPIRAIFYAHHPQLALRELERVAEEAVATYPIATCILIHRVGEVPAGEPSLFLRVESKHRDEAYSASRLILENLKSRVPIWKKPLVHEFPTND